MTYLTLAILKEIHGLLGNKNKKVIRKIDIETSVFFWIDQFNCLRSEMYAFECGDDRKNKLEGI